VRTVEGGGGRVDFHQHIKPVRKKGSRTCVQSDFLLLEIWWERKKGRHNFLKLSAKKERDGDMRIVKREVKKTTNGPTGHLPRAGRKVAGHRRGEEGKERFSLVPKFAKGGEDCLFVDFWRGGRKGGN